MQTFLLENYDWLRALHIIAFVAWMAGMLYLPRLFVYHSETVSGLEQSETFKVMERRLMRFIMTPAMIVTWVFGLLMLTANPALMGNGWMHVKLLCVIVLSGLHGFFAATMTKFARDENVRPAKFYRYINEAPTALMIIIVIMAVAEPF